ncbi:unnamed protein product [Polarella glacialis]|uniref:STAS domain-containing protein n=1 Tax=Polarella glacialis TaxID=89957 RepID=A0A813FYK5_POLGL|nr:unnamed protein product [Polarella glacialis]
MLFMVFSIRVGPSLLNQCFPKSTFVPKVAGLICQLLPLGLFYLVLAISGVSWASLEDSGWTYPRQASTGPMGLWTTYSAADVHWPTVLATMPAMPSLVLMSVMCTLMGALAITDAFPSGPDGDPAPMETLNFDTELVTVGASSMLLGLTGGNVNFHKFSVIQLRLDGGTHRIAVLMIALFAGGLFVSGVPIGQLIPKWFLAGLFVNTGMHFVKGTLFSYRSMPRFDWRGWKLPSSQGIIGPSCVLFAVFFSPAKAILFGLVLSITFFLSSSAAASPVINVVSGDRVVSRSKRPCWEMRVLRREGDRILLLYLQGQLFFGSTQQLVAALAATAVDDHVRFIIISLARVPHIDPSAARHLKAASEKLKKRGCEVIFCRMNREVFSILSAAKVVAAPDPDLVKHLQNLRWKSTPMSPKPSKRISRPASPELGPWTNKRLLRPASKGSSLGERTPDACADLRAVPPLDFTIVLAETPAVGGQSRNADEPVAPNSEMFSPQSSTKDPGSLEEAAHEARPDAFCHETDALDYCDERLVAEFCYSCESHAATLEPYMLAFRAAVHTGLRLPEWAFEDMNGLPRGMMLQLQKFCDVHVGLPAWTKISDTMDLKGALCFVLKGSVSVIQHVPLSDDSSLVNAELHGFSFRQGKRLLKRYPPGHVAGKDYFFNTHSGQVIDQELEPKIDVSSKLGPPAEIWVLRLEMWDRMPLELKATMTEMLCAQFADDIQHSRLQEH